MLSRFDRIRAGAAMPPEIILLAEQVRELKGHLCVLEESRRELIDAFRNTVEVSRSLREQLDEANAILARFDDIEFHQATSQSYEAILETNLPAIS